MNELIVDLPGHQACSKSHILPSAVMRSDQGIKLPSSASMLAFGAGALTGGLVATVRHTSAADTVVHTDSHT